MFSKKKMNGSQFGLNGTGSENFGGEYEFYDELNWTWARIQRVITLTVLLVLSFIGNSIIIIVLTFSKTNRTFSRVNIFILNLAVGDLFVALVTILSELILEVI